MTGGDYSSAAWAEAFRLAAAIPPDNGSANRQERRKAIHAFWQAVIRALREGRG